MIDSHLLFYFSVGDVADAIPFFNSTGNQCPRNFNPSDFFLDVLSPDSRTEEVRRSATYSLVQQSSLTFILIDWSGPFS